MYNVFIDGREGTTGLQIFERQAQKADVGGVQALLSRLRVFALIENKRARVIDASTAHRTNPEWVYGLPEISKERRGEIAESNRVANPGCHATGFISLVAPLVKGGIVGADYPFVAHSVTGYSGGGKKMIAEYEAEERDILLDSPRQYALTLSHKHIPQ